MHEIEQVLNETSLLPQDDRYPYLSGVVASWPASTVRQNFPLICNLVDSELDPLSQNGINAHLLRQLTFAADTRITTLKMRLSRMDGGPEAIESSWTEGWGDIKPWSENTNPGESIQTDE